MSLPARSRLCSLLTRRLTSFSGDFWALALSRHFIKGTNAANFFDASSHGAGQTFSSFLNL